MSYWAVWHISFDQLSNVMLRKGVQKNTQFKTFAIREGVQPLMSKVFGAFLDYLPK